MTLKYKVARATIWGLLLSRRNRLEFNDNRNLATPPTGNLTPVATATKTLSQSQITSNNNTSVAAHTTTQPFLLTVATIRFENRTSKRNHCPPSELLTNKIDKPLLIDFRRSLLFRFLARIHSLLMPRSPSTISRFIVAIVVNAVNGVIKRRSATHIGQKSVV